jgi:predicted NBD/HSP70 family sugar kinase
MDVGGAFRNTPQQHVGKRTLLLRLILAAQPITRSQLAERLGIDRSSVTENVSPLIRDGMLREENDVDEGGRSQRYLSFATDRNIFLGVNLGVRHSQVGAIRLDGRITDEAEFATPPEPGAALRLAHQKLRELRSKYSDLALGGIGVSVPGMTDPLRSNLIYAPNLDWRSVAVADALRIDPSAPVIVENDSTASAMFEARRMIGRADSLMSDFIVVRSGTGIGVGMVIGNEIYRGTGTGRGVAGEFGHMTIVAGGKPCVCGNRGCWEKYGSAAAAGSLYAGERATRPGQTPRFLEVVTKANNGDNRAKATLEKIGDYLGIGIANVIMGTGIARVIISGRLVYGWDLIEKPVNDAIKRSIIGNVDGWSVEAGSPAGSAIGGALEVAVDQFLVSL